MKRILSCILALLLILTSLNLTAVFAAAGTPTIGFNSVETEAGKTISLQLTIQNNPGIAGLAVSLKYDTNVLTLIETEQGTLFSGFAAGKNFAWDESEDVTANGVLATFTFAVSETATPKDYSIEVIVRSCINENLDDVACHIQNGTATVICKHSYDNACDPTCNECGEVREIPVLPGDVNDDGTVNVRDYGLLQQYLNGWNVTIVEVAANVNGDSTINVRDLGLLQQYLNGWDVTLGK